MNIGCHVTTIQYLAVRQKAAQAGLNVSEYIRQATLSAQVKMRWDEEERQIFKGLAGLSNDIHHLVTVADREGSLQAMLFFLKYRDQIDGALKRLYDAQ